MKAQAEIIREVLTFSIGVGVVSACTLIFSTYIPNIVINSLADAYLFNLATHFDLLLNDVYLIISHFPNSSIVYIYPMPRTILGSSYELRMRNFQACARLLSPARELCKNSSLPQNVEVTGNFIGGEAIVLNGTHLLSGDIIISVSSK
ncbi:MAG: hypothetical protein QW507_02065 [Candidatus Nanoarchaeia archaeon]|nr:hypothetical protein [Candidatus Haiyanarchaeum thermophilum]MCW1302801.1 hypothetical protein [Candidatus Haiyanarchaeum thermophilum]MCW1303482.1 hypothetical protein [Candidatus Haiyanarchaeum thermophilum]MCW1306662.1 hypothetical protein [Candidatus Haiyanarchaeum thermophilum]MCW1307382.1 hypothetical protein [Candidatus Haiyanarchaeum thermophilum]